MNEMFVITWKDRTGERSGRGRKMFSKEEAEQLVQELNREYPNFTHEVAQAGEMQSEAVAQDAAK